MAGFDKYGVDEDLRSYLRDVADHVVQVNERVEGFRLLLRDILTVNATLVAQRQNEEIRRAHRDHDRAGRGGQEDLRLGGHPVRPDADRHGLRDELRPHARAALALGYLLALLLMALVSVRALRRLQAPQLDLSRL